MLMNNIQIQQIHRSDIDLIQQAADLYAGVGKLHVGKPDNLRLLAYEHTLFGATNGSSELSGALLAGSLDNEDAEWDYNRYLALPRRISHEGTIELMDMAVAIDHRRKGIATELVETALECYGFCKRFVAASRFAGGDKDSSFGLLLSQRFTVLKEAPTGYYASPNFVCLDCGGICQCPAFLMMRENLP